MSWDEAVIAGPDCDAAGSSAHLPDPDGGQAPTHASVVQYEWRDAWVVVADGEYDMDSVTPLAEALTTAAIKHPKVLLDTSGVTFADSSFLNLIILVHQTTALRVVAPGPQLLRLLKVTGTDAILHVRATVEEAAGS
ncbi:STAS domain-containing protein [Streptomyces sp. NPDC051322]|uniref:STAS domain-containing protein n=1 Tax=Streptomyces sp. NPDC051322 TaxID=3154645 RepID=UPI00344D879B